MWSKWKMHRELVIAENLAEKLLCLNIISFDYIIIWQIKYLFYFLNCILVCVLLLE